MNADNAAGRDHQSTSVTIYQQAQMGVLGPARRVLFMIALTACLGACGGGGDSGSPATTVVETPAPVVSPAAPSDLAAFTSIVGVFGGTLSDDHGYDLLYVVLRDGTKLCYFGTDWSNSFQFVGSWVSTDSAYRWVSQDGTRSGTFNGSYRGEPAFVTATFDMAVPRLSGLITAGQLTTKTVAFGGGAIPGSTYRFAAAATVAAVEGKWDLVDQAGNAVAINIAPDGGLKGSYRGCSFTGSAKPSDGGALMLSFDFDEPVANCQPELENTAAYMGFAIALPMTGGGTRLVIFAESFAGWDWMSFAAVGQR